MLAIYNNRARASKLDLNIFTSLEADIGKDLGSEFIMSESLCIIKSILDPFGGIQP